MEGTDGDREGSEAGRDETEGSREGRKKASMKE